MKESEIKLLDKFEDIINFEFKLLDIKFAKLHEIDKIEYDQFLFFWVVGKYINLPFIITDKSSKLNILKFKNIKFHQFGFFEEVHALWVNFSIETIKELVTAK